MLRTLPCICAVSLALLACGFVSAQDTVQMGWLQRTNGTYLYDDPANWLGGNVNGVFGTNLTSKATIRLQHTEPFTIDNDRWTFLHPGEVQLEFIGYGETPVTATIAEDLNLTVNTTKGNFRFGANSTTDQLILDLAGGTRAINSGLDIYLWNPVRNGSLILNSANSKWLYLVNDATIEGDVTVRYANGLCFKANNPHPGSVRAHNVTLQNGQLIQQFHNNSDINESITGSLFIDVDPENRGSYNHLNFSASLRNHYTLRAASLERVGSAILFLSGNQLGIDPATDGSINVYFDTPPALTPGATDDPAAPGILPWVYHNGNNWVTYDETRGLRPLNRDTEYAVFGSGADYTNRHLLIPANTTCTNDTDITVQSLLLDGNDLRTNTVLRGSGTIRVTSGAVRLGYHRNATPSIESNLDFGDVRGIFYVPKGKASYISGTVTGNNGIIIVQNDHAIVTDSGGTGPTLAATSRISGDCCEFSKTQGGSAFWPHGDRTGDLYNYGIIEYYDTTLNGLYGNGIMFSGYVGLTLGDNDADGDFSGTIQQRNTVRLTKIGTGTQRLSGSITVTGGIAVEGGTLDMDGTVSASTATVAADATLSGSGTFQAASPSVITVDTDATLAPGEDDGSRPMTLENGGITFADQAILDLGTLDRDTPADANRLAVSGSILGADATVLVSASGADTGKWRVATAAAFEPTFVPAPGTRLRLFFNEDGTELWAERLTYSIISIH